jgi:hypothetical protein
MAYLPPKKKSLCVSRGLGQDLIQYIVFEHLWIVSCPHGSASVMPPTNVNYNWRGLFLQPESFFVNSATNPLFWIS